MSGFLWRLLHWCTQGGGLTGLSLVPGPGRLRAEHSARAYGGFREGRDVDANT